MKKAPIAVALVLVFGLFAAGLSLAPVLAQIYSGPAPTSTSNATSSNATSSANTTTSSTNATSNATSSTNATTTGSTFTASGSIASLIFDMGEESATTSNATSTSSTNETSTTSNMTGTTSGNLTDNSTGMTGNTSGSTTLSQIITGNDSSTTNDTSSNMTGTSNATSTSNATDTTTSADNATATEVELPYIVSGDWNLDVQDGNVSDFSATFTMVHTDGSGRHTHDITNFAVHDATSVTLNQEGTTFIFGTASISVNGTEKWTDADTLITIEKMNAISIVVDSEDTDDHFQGQPIYGVVDSLMLDGQEMIQTSGANQTQTSGNATGQNATGTAGEFVSNLTEGVQDFFSGGNSTQ